MLGFPVISPPGFSRQGPREPGLDRETRGAGLIYAHALASKRKRARSTFVAFRTAGLRQDGRANGRRGRESDKGQTGSGAGKGRSKAKEGSELSCVRVRVRTSVGGRVANPLMGSGELVALRALKRKGMRYKQTLPQP